MDNHANSGLVIIYTATGILHAIVLQNILELTGIPVKLDYETYKFMPGFPSALCGEVNLLVPSLHEKDALSLLNAESPSGETFGLLNHSWYYLFYRHTK